jgi:hypothetical protein
MELGWGGAIVGKRASELAVSGDDVVGKVW